MAKISNYLKAIAAAIAAFLGVLADATTDGGSHISAHNWILAAIAFIGTGSIVWGVPNVPPTNTSVATATDTSTTTTGA